MSINASGAVTGYVTDTFGSHGFVRDPGGKVTKFEVNAATVPLSINDAGEITGFWQDNNGLDHAWVRAVDGTITTFAGNGIDRSAVSIAINADGTATGDINGMGFLRPSDGRISLFLVDGKGPNVTSINQLDWVVGYFTPFEPNRYFWRGFVRTE
jgi:hypothetical protein